MQRYLDKVILSQDRRTAAVVMSDKTFTLWHSEGKVVDLVKEIVFDRRAEAAEETTAKIDLQLSFDLDAA